MMISKFTLAIVGFVVFATASLVGLVGIQVYAQGTENDPLPGIQTTILAIAGAVSAVATLISLVGSKYLVKNADNKLVQTIVHGADYLKGTDEFLAKNSEDLATGLEVAFKYLPAEAQAELRRRGKDIDSIRAAAEDFTADVRRVHKIAEKVG